jgi:transcriptional regulator with XRE-family HTH domain
VDDVRIGLLLRFLRRRRGFTQRDLASAAGLSQALVSMVERGHLGSVSADRLRRLFAAVEARYQGDVSWRGGAIDRLLDEGHAVLVGATAAKVQARDWSPELEVTFNSYGDRGSIDILALQRSASAVLVIEIKTELTSIEETIRRLDVKERLARDIVLERYGWRPGTVGRLLVIREGATNRRRVAAHQTVLRTAFPAQRAELRAWMSAPAGRLSALTISSSITPRNQRRDAGASKHAATARSRSDISQDPTLAARARRAATNDYQD